MIQKKICMLGASAVGKTSLVQRYVQGIFNDQYLTTVGVKIDKKPIDLGEQKVLMMLWDLQGEDRFHKVQMSYLRGTSGYLLVADGTRRETLDRALTLKEEAESVIGDAPFTLLLNKVDLTDDWEIEETMIATLEDRGWRVVKTSAKTGDHVEETFINLAERMLGS